MSALKLQCRDTVDMTCIYEDEDHFELVSTAETVVFYHEPGKDNSSSVHLDEQKVRELTSWLLLWLHTRGERS